MTMERDPIFETAHNALLFAFNFSDQQYERPLMNRLADDPVGHVSKGLSGMDGAAQAGMIFSRMKLLSDLSQHILFAQYAPPTIRCTCGRACCTGRKPNELWEYSINEISRASITGATVGVLSYRILRDAVVRKMFGVKADIVKAADRCGLSERSAYDHQAAIKRWLDGKRVPGKDDKPGVRVVAFEHFARIMVDSGMVMVTADSHAC